ncbi:MAG: uracil-DNA glycosylase [Anaerolineales bacterium]|nr:uracil-DNA glycosylase [Anaerolineales bacterium]
MENPLDKIASEIKICTKCDLNFGRKRAVPGDGPADAKIMFIGEGPGFHEDQQGIPFVGAAGRFLEELLDMIDLKREKVYITNVVKCRPPGNRDPRPDEIETCRSYLDRQIAAILPKMIITLGRYSMARYFPNARISDIHGQPRKIEGILYYPMYHPAAALHQPSLRSILEADMVKIPDLINRIDEFVDSKPQQQVRQLNLF